jgi:uncharacterized protein (TIGR00369 family)
VTDFPPYARLLRLKVVSPDDEPVRLQMPFHEDVMGRPGFLHGGAIAGLLEFAAFTTLAREIGDDRIVMKPVTVTIDYLRGGIRTDTLAEAAIERLGKRIANVEAYAWQRDRAKPIAAARINFLLDRP